MEWCGINRSVSDFCYALLKTVLYTAKGRQRPIAASAQCGFRNGKRMHSGSPLLDCPNPYRLIHRLSLVPIGCGLKG